MWGEKRGIGCVRAQITLETLLLVALGLGILLFSIAMAHKLTDTQIYTYESAIFKRQVLQISQFADEICVLGDGNSRMLRLSGIGFYMDTGLDKKGIVAQRGEIGSVAQTICPLEISGEEFGAVVFLWYEDEKVFISPAPKGQENSAEN